VRRSEEQLVRIVKNRRGLALAVLLSASVPGLAAPATAESPSPHRAATVACGDVAELIRQINHANTAGSGVITLAAGCTYTLTAAAETSGPDGANGLPTITGQLIIYGQAATITRARALRKIAKLQVSGLSQLTLGTPLPDFGNAWGVFAGQA
jgi:hypothetical protein